MAGMPGYHVNKGPFFYLDKMFDGTDAVAYTNALAALGPDLTPQGQRARDYLNSAAGQRFRDNPADPGDPNPKLKSHFDNDWLNAGPNWKTLFPAETLRAGLREAISVAVDNREDPKGPPLPMEFFWVCAQEKAFHVYYSISEFLGVGGNPNRKRVTVIVFTPIPEHGPGGGAPQGTKEQVPDKDLGAAEPIWVVKLKETYEDNFAKAGGQPGAGYPGAPAVVDREPSGPNDPPGKKPGWEIVSRQIYYEKHLGPGV